MKDVSNQIGRIYQFKTRREIQQKNSLICKCILIRKFQRNDKNNVKDFATDCSSQEVGQTLTQTW